MLLIAIGSYYIFNDLESFINIWDDSSIMFGNIF